MKENTLGKPCEKRSGFPAFAGKKTVALKDTCVLIMGQSPSSESYNVNGKGLPFYQGNADFGEDNPTPRSWCTDPKKIAEKGDILISVRAPIGAINIANERCCIGRGIAAIRPNQDLTSTNFLRHQLSASRSKLEAMGTGSTFKAIGKKALSDFAIALYSKSEQEVIVHQLDCIAAQIKAANNQLIRFDALIKSRFIEMFGDPIENPKGWRSSSLKEVAPAKGDPVPDKGTVWSLGLDAVEAGTGMILRKDIAKADSLKSSNIGFSARHVLYSKLRPYLNKVVLPEEIGVCTTELLPLLPNQSELNRVYLCYLLRSDSFVSFISGHTNGAKMPRADMNTLNSFGVSIPPLALQQEFADFVSQVDKLRFAVQQQIDRLEMLKKSLLQEYFS